MWSRRLLRSCKGLCRINGVQTSPSCVIRVRPRGLHAETRADRHESVNASLHHLSIENALRPFDTSTGRLSSHAKKPYTDELSSDSYAPAPRSSDDSNTQSSDEMRTRSDGTAEEVEMVAGKYTNIEVTLGNVPSPGSCFKFRDDAWYISENAAMGIARITRAMSFKDAEDMLQAVAETLLRILEFRTPFLEIQGIKAKAVDTPKLEALACWHSADDPPDPLTGKMKVSFEELTAKPDATGDMLEAKGTESHRPGDTAELANDVNNGKDPHNDTIQIELIQLGPVRKDQLLQFRSPNIRLETPRDRCGFSKYSFTATWPTELGAQVQQLTRSQILRMADNAKVGAFDSVAKLKEATERLRGSIPGTPTILFRLTARAKRGATDLLAPEPWPIKEVYTTMPARGSDFSLSTHWVPVETMRWMHAASEAHLGVRMKFSAEVSLIPSALSDPDATAHHQVASAIGACISTVMEHGHPATPNELASQCIGAIMEQKLLAGIANIKSVNVSLSQDSTSSKSTVSAKGSRCGQAIIALGSNLGHRVANIEAACEMIDQDPDMQMKDISPLYETRPMYYKDQGTFVNGACLITTSLDPMQLLDRLQSIENALGRMRLIDKGPRSIDLDIIMYDYNSIQTDRLIIPHKLMLEREFVLRPISDMDYGATTRHPGTGQTVAQHLQQLVTGDLSMFPLTPLASECELIRSLDPKRRTHVMSILNVTPDSFSDGGVNISTDLDALRGIILSHIASGATIIDVGGQSSRPNAPDITAEEEIARILPAIEIIKALPEAQHVSISVDTYRASVAEAAIKTGAHIINDISAGLLDPDMLPTIARLGCTYIMMHMRGTPATMQDPENTSYPEGLISTVAKELAIRTHAAHAAGIPRWRIILDPGIGFAKTVEQNAELLGKFAGLRNHAKLKTYPWLVGSSRKGFIGKLTGVEDAKDRIDGTAATVTAAVAGGAEIVRVHDVKEMARVVKMADAMYRSSPSPSTSASSKDSREVQDQGQDEKRKEK